MITHTGFVFRSKKSGDYFRFEEYCEDGYGKYEDTISLKYFSGGDSLPTIFSTDQFPIYVFKDHLPADVEAIPITISIG